MADNPAFMRKSSRRDYSGRGGSGGSVGAGQGPTLDKRWKDEFKVLDKPTISAVLEDVMKLEKEANVKVWRGGGGYGVGFWSHLNVVWEG